MKCKRCNIECIKQARGLCYKCYPWVRANKLLSKYPKTKRKGIRTCKVCGQKKKIQARNMCAACYMSKSRIMIGRKSVYVHAAGMSLGDFQKQVKEMKNEILNDILKNPKKWLDKTEN
jgi:hypothetical protein